MRKKLLATAAVIALAAMFFVAFNFHVVTGSSVDGVNFEKKLSASLSETFVNLDSVGNMPMIVARAQYPMYVARIESRLEKQKNQMSQGCQNLYVGMQIYEIIPKCGQPDVLKTSGADADMRWDTGVHIKTSGDKIVYIKSN